MQTRKLYYEDSHLRRFCAKVLSCEQTEKGYEVILDATAFYPEGGGQACDLGTLGGAKVLDVRENAGKPEAEEFVKRYAGVVSYILATILLTRQSSFPVDLACRRVQIIHRHIGELCGQCSKVSKEIAAVFQEAASLLTSKLDEFASTFHH